MFPRKKRIPQNGKDYWYWYLCGNCWNEGKSRRSFEWYYGKQKPSAADVRLGESILSMSAELKLHGLNVSPMVALKLNKDFEGMLPSDPKLRQIARRKLCEVGAFIGDGKGVFGENALTYNQFMTEIKQFEIYTEGDTMWSKRHAIGFVDRKWHKLGLFDESKIGTTLHESEHIRQNVILKKAGFEMPGWEPAKHLVIEPLACLVPGKFGQKEYVQSKREMWSGTHLQSRRIQERLAAGLVKYTGDNVERFNERLKRDELEGVIKIVILDPKRDMTLLGNYPHLKPVTKKIFKFYDNMDNKESAYMLKEAMEEANNMKTDVRWWDKDVIVPNSQRLKYAEEGIIAVAALLDEEASAKYIDRFVELKKKFLKETALIADHEWSSAAGKILSEMGINEWECMAEAKVTTPEKAKEEIEWIRKVSL